MYEGQAGEHVKTQQGALVWLLQHVHTRIGLMASHVHVLCKISGCSYLPHFFCQNYICQNHNSGYFVNILHYQNISRYGMWHEGHWGMIALPVGWAWARSKDGHWGTCMITWHVGWAWAMSHDRHWAVIAVHVGWACRSHDGQWGVVEIVHQFGTTWTNAPDTYRFSNSYLYSYLIFLFSRSSFCFLRYLPESSLTWTVYDEHEFCRYIKNPGTISFVLSSILSWSNLSFHFVVDYLGSTK